LWAFSYLYLAFFGVVSEYTGMIYRIKYLESVLIQDIPWFEDNNPLSLSSKINKETLAIQTATGEKFANIIFSLSMMIAGFMIAFAIGWKFSLVSL
jgi:ATP-binding cassette, subfamily B (MDR/TAP), member 1